MSPNPPAHNLKVVTSGQPEEFTFQGLRFSPAEPTAASGGTYNCIEDSVYTWTPAQEAARSAGQGLHTETSPDSSDDARQRLRRVVSLPL